jgi:hypothetical protein
MVFGEAVGALICEGEFRFVSEARRLLQQIAVNRDGFSPVSASGFPQSPREQGPRVDNFR